MNRFISLLSFFSASALVIPATHADLASHIFGGTAVQADDPIAGTTVFISGKSHLGYFLCSGSLIAQDIVVTAAHCVVDGQQDAFRVIFMRDVPISYLTEKPSVSDTDPSVRLVYGAIANPDYDKNATQDAHDIAVLRIKGILPAGYQTATLLDPAASLVAGEEVTLAGYGSTNPLISGKGGTLNKVDVSIKQTLGLTEIVVDQSEGKGGCWGDSGGPAFVKNGDQLLLWGLTNRAFPQHEPTCSHGAVYTRITDYADFISSAENTLRAIN